MFQNVETKVLNIGSFGYIGGPKTWKYRESIDVGKNYIKMMEIVIKIWKLLMKL